MAQSVPSPAWSIIYDGANITGHIENQVTEVRWVERIGGQAAEASFTVDDSLHKWQGSSYPKPTDELQLSIGYAGAALHGCGTFTVDEFEFSSPPDRMEVKCIQSWMTQSLRTPNAQVYQGMTFQQIASSVAQKYGWNVVLASGDVPDSPWNLKVQKLGDGGDLGFLTRLADELNFEVNVRPPQIIFYYRPALETQAPSGPKITRQQVKSAQFRWQSMADQTYEGAAGSYPDPVTGQTLNSQVQSSGGNVSANQLNFSARVENNQQAAAMAASALHQQNMLLFQATLEMPGTVAYLSGQTVSLPSSDWGIFAGTWLIEESEHTLRPTEGYMTRLTARTAGPASNIVPGGAASS